MATFARLQVEMTDNKSLLLTIGKLLLLIGMVALISISSFTLENIVRLRLEVTYADEISGEERFCCHGLRLR